MWIPVQSLPIALSLNIGDILEVFEQNYSQLFV